MSLQELKEKNQNKNDEDVSDENLECVLSCYEALLRQLGRKLFASIRVARVDLRCDSTLRGRVREFSPPLRVMEMTSPEEEVQEEEERTPPRASLASEARSSPSSRSSKVPPLLDLRTTTTSTSTMMNSPLQRLSATLSPSIKDAIDVEKIALQDPKRFRRFRFV